MNRHPSNPQEQEEDEDGDAVRVRRTRPEDHEALYDIYRQPGVIAGTLQLPYPSPEVWRQRAAAVPDGTYSLVAATNGRVVGNLGLTVPRNPRRAHTGYIGMAVHDAWQGRGIGTALMNAALELADGWLGLTRVELQVYVDNDPAVRLYRRTGFEVEGTLSGYALRNGVLVDSFTMARLRPPPGAERR